MACFEGSCRHVPFLETFVESQEFSYSSFKFCAREPTICSLSHVEIPQKSQRFVSHREFKKRS
jgi:hypothetical protein